MEFPGAVDESLARPDFVKVDILKFVYSKKPILEKFLRFQRKIRNSPLGVFPVYKNIALEEFLYHGFPGEEGSPMDDFLNSDFASHFPSAAKDQLRFWKQAQIGLYKIEKVFRDRMTLREWHPLQKSKPPSFGAISLNIGGVKTLRSLRGQFLLTHVAPWNPDNDLYCAIGYGLVNSAWNANYLATFLWLRHPELLVETFPWKDPEQRRKYLQVWKERDWYTWLQENLVFPFDAILQPFPGEYILQKQYDLIPMRSEDAKEFGIYFNADKYNHKLVVGATLVFPTEIDSPNYKILEEYRAYREWAGYPPRAKELEAGRRLPSID